MGVKWEKTELSIANGETVVANTPIIISASRSTDIPAFYSDWLLNRLSAGYVAWINPFNNQKTYTSFEKARVIVFWTKNPSPLCCHLDRIETLGFHNYYFQYTLNDYEKEGLEPNVPPLKNRVETFKSLVNRIGEDRVIWRFDPLLLTKEITIKTLTERVQRIRDEVSGYTKKLVISFLDLDRYNKVQQNAARTGSDFREFTEEEMNEIAQEISRIAKEGGIKVATCAEKIDLEKYGIEHNRCIDDDLMIKCFSKDRELMDFLGVEISDDLFGGEGGRTIRNMKDAGQRETCGCIASKDIGRYSTCPHLCKYCYANGKVSEVLEFKRNHNPNSDLL
jgi:DNA repair photolyase